MASNWLSRYLSLRQLLAVILAGISLLSTQVRADDVGEYDLKAAFLYNFAVFTEWPGDAPTGMNLCVIGTDPFGPTLKKLENKQVGTAAVSVRRITSNDGIRSCHVLFISASEVGNLSLILEASRGLPVLTVADAPGAASSGVMIGLVMQDQRVKFEINLTAARAARLSISSKLVKLARNVYTP